MGYISRSELEQALLYFHTELTFFFSNLIYPSVLLVCPFDPGSVHGARFASVRKSRQNAHPRLRKVYDGGGGGMRYW